MRPCQLNTVPLCSIQHSLKHPPEVISGAAGHLVWIQPIRQICAEVCDGSGPIHDLLWICVCVCVYIYTHTHCRYVCMKTLHLPQSVHFTERAKDERSLIRDKRLKKKEWKSLRQAKQRLYFMKRRVKDGVTRERTCNKRNWEEDTKVKDRRFSTSIALNGAAFFCK